MRSSRSIRRRRRRPAPSTSRTRTAFRNPTRRSRPRRASIWPSSTPGPRSERSTMRCARNMASNRSSELYRVAVAASGTGTRAGLGARHHRRVRGFSMPLLQRAESALRALLEQYPREVRVVFRNLPLAQIHPHAEAAAAAAVCADRQGKFWEMHDAMYARSERPQRRRAQGHGEAARSGPQSSFRLASPTARPAAALDADLKAAQALGLSGTPYFFINGRPVDGNVPLEEFREHHRRGAARGSAGSRMSGRPLGLRSVRPFVHHCLGVVKTMNRFGKRHQILSVSLGLLGLAAAWGHAAGAGRGASMPAPC